MAPARQCTQIKFTFLRRHLEIHIIGVEWVCDWWPQAAGKKRSKLNTVCTLQRKNENSNGSAQSTDIPHNSPFALPQKIHINPVDSFRLIANSVFFCRFYYHPLLQSEEWRLCCCCSDQKGRGVTYRQTVKMKRNLKCWMPMHKNGSGSRR